jgi:hypothetical protein
MPHVSEGLKLFAEIKAGKFRPFASKYVIGTDANAPRLPEVGVRASGNGCRKSAGHSGIGQNKGR